MNKCLFKGDIKSFLNEEASPFYGSICGLLNSYFSLSRSLDKFRESINGSEEEGFWWSHCEKLLLEIENYKEILPEEVSHLILDHVLSSSPKKESKLLINRLQEDIK